MRRLLLPIIALPLLGPSPAAMAQGATAVPFLLISPSPESNGMAGTSVAVRREDPTSAVFAPAQVGLWSLSTGIRGGFYPAATAWLPGTGVYDLTYSSWGIGGGVSVNDLVELPVRIGIGVAYHRVDFDLGQFIITGSGGPDPIATFDAHEKASGVVIGIGAEFLIRAAFGHTHRSIDSDLGAFGGEQGGRSAQAHADAQDYSFYFALPTIAAAEILIGKDVLFGPGLHPFFDLSLGYAWNNIGDSIVYGDSAQADPLPRTARVGAGLSGGLTLNNAWQVVALTWSREAEDLLVTSDSAGWEYQSGTGDIDFWDNVVNGKRGNATALRAGWQLELGEFFTYRAGKVMGNPEYGTQGYSFRLAGLLKGIAVFAGSETPAWVLFARDHIDAMYHHASYDAVNSPFDGTTFSGMTVAVRVLPW